MTEGNGQHAHFMFTVSLSQQSDSAVTLHYATVDGSATAGQGTMSPDPAPDPRPASHLRPHVDIVGDAAEESDETFTVTLSAPSGATISRATATGTIVDDDMGDARPGDDGDHIDLASFGDFHGSDHRPLGFSEGGGTAITTEALVAYNNLQFAV